MLPVDAVLEPAKAVYNHWTGLVDWIGGLDWWTDTKIDFKLPNNFWSCVETL